MRMKIAEALGKGIANWQIVPENMNITAIAEGFEKAINIGLPTGRQTRPAPPAAPKKPKIMHGR
jgi:hypothetical protein